MKMSVPKKSRILLRDSVFRHQLLRPCKASPASWALLLLRLSSSSFLTV